MDVLEAIRKRKSIRKFTPQPVPGAILKEILAVASRAPSAENTQPWEFTILEGAVLDRVREETIASLRAGRRPPDEMAHLHVERPKGSVFRERQVAIAKQLFALMGIGREDAGKRVAWLERGFRYFDAPHAIIVAVDDCLPVHGAAIDVGGVTQTICLAAMAFGLGTCIENQGITYADIVRKHAGIPDSRRLMAAVAIGYADPDFPANTVLSEREPIENITTWMA
jgi:nitroreductase